MKRKYFYSKNNFVSDETVVSPDAVRRRENLKVLFNHTTVIPFKWKGQFVCFYCRHTYTEYGKFRKHTRSHGPYKDSTLKRITSQEIKIDVSEIICDLCQDEFKSVDVIIDHLIEKHSKVYDKAAVVMFSEYRLSDLRCLNCDEQFAKFQDLLEHVNSVHVKSKYVCDKCGKTFRKSKEIVMHITKYHGTGYSCAMSEKQFQNEVQLSEHKSQVHINQSRKCLKYARKIKNTERSAKKCTICDFCFREFATAIEMSLHLVDCEAKTFKQEKYDAKKQSTRRALCDRLRQNIQCVLNMSTAVPFKFKAKFCCFYCSKWFTIFDELILHTRSEHPFCELKSNAMKACKGEKSCIKLDINALACKVCHQPMSDLISFVDHAIVEHEANFEKSVPLSDCFEAFQMIQGRIPCPQCKEPFTYFASLLKHLGAEHSNYKAVCSYCGRGFRTATSLAMHISNSHTGMCECSTCGAKCQNSAALARHMARYHDAKDFKCSQCPELFETIYKKQKHLIKVHNVGHKCGYCDKMFTKNSFMMNHVRRTHLKERTVPCSICNLKFFDKYHMKLHMVKHEGERRFKCEVCGKNFLRLRNLRSHVETHKKAYMQEIF